MRVIEQGDVLPSLALWYVVEALLLLLRFRLYRNGAMMEQPKWGQVVIARG